jgi:phage gp46-like protein
MHAWWSGLDWTGTSGFNTPLGLLLFFFSHCHTVRVVRKKAKAYAEQKRASKLLAPTADAATKVAADDALKVLKVLLSLPAR